MTTIKTVVLDIGKTSHREPICSLGPIRTFQMFSSMRIVDKIVLPDVIEQGDDILKIEGYKVLGHIVRERG